jgi:SAM-dependent methyltransferase
VTSTQAKPSAGEFMHGHRKKARFFIECLDSLARELGRSPRDIEVLDIGCGNGLNVSLPVAERGFNVTGIDPHGPSIEAAQSSQSVSNARFLKQGFAEHHSELSYDAVILSDVLEHVPDPDALIVTAMRSLSPRGQLLISIPNGYGPFEVEQYLIRRGVLSPVLWFARGAVALGVAVKRLIRRRPFAMTPPGPPPSNEECGHVQFFSLRRFERLLKAHGLVIERRANGAWFGGDLTYFLFYFVPILVPVTLRVADLLPAVLVSSWYFRCRRSTLATSHSVAVKTPAS